MVCLGGYGTHWVPSLNLDELCGMLWDMARYHNYDIRSPYNREAALWVANQTTFRFPLDARPLRDLRAALGRVETEPISKPVAPPPRRRTPEPGSSPSRRPATPRSTRSRSSDQPGDGPSRTHPTAAPRRHRDGAVPPACRCGRTARAERSSSTWRSTSAAGRRRRPRTRRSFSSNEPSSSRSAQWTRSIPLTFLDEPPRDRASQPREAEPGDEPALVIDDDDRYSRLRLIPWWRQERLAAARVLVVGAGALGNEVLKNLALLGVGTIYVIDLDDGRAVEPVALGPVPRRGRRPVQGRGRRRAAPRDQPRRHDRPDPRRRDHRPRPGTVRRRGRRDRLPRQPRGPALGQPPVLEGRARPGSTRASRRSRGSSRSSSRPTRRATNAR